MMCPASVSSVLPVTAMNPDETPSEPNTSEDVRTYTMPGCLETILLEKPEIVTTKAAAGITAPAVVMTTDVAVVAPLGARPADLQRIPTADANVCLYPELAGTLCSWLERQFGMACVRTVPILSLIHI